MSEDKKPFKVSDRRHFTPEGEARATVATGEAASEARPPASSARPHAAGPISFAAFLLSLGAQAGLLLGEGREAPEGAPDVEGAREIISILEMLKDKTEGGRTRDEDQVLEELLYELRMAYIEKTRAGRA